MNDLDLVTAFERGTLTAFPHRDHVRVAWILLEREGFDGAVIAMTGICRCNSLRMMRVALIPSMMGICTSIKTA